jgi:hypothetical protein
MRPTPGNVAMGRRMTTSRISGTQRAVEKQWTTASAPKLRSSGQE